MNSVEGSETAAAGGPVSEKSSRAKSPPMSAELVTLMSMVTEVADPEFQVVANCCQTAVVEGRERG